MKKSLFRKTVDQSLLKSGLTIPKELQNNLLELIGVKLFKGQKDNIKIVVDESNYDATITNVNFSEGVTDREVVQIRYSTGSPICQKLIKVFSRSQAYISQKGDDGKAGAIPEDQKEYVEVLAVGPKTLDEFYNTNAFINSLPYDERRFFEILRQGKRLVRVSEIL